MKAQADISALTRRAMEVRERFAQLERSRAGRPWTKEEVMQGFVGDVGDLMKLVMAKGGLRDIPDHDRKLAHELSDCLWSVLVLAELYEVDLHKEFFATMDQVEKQIALKVSEANQSSEPTAGLRPPVAHL